MMNFEIPLALGLDIAILIAIGIAIWKVSRWMTTVELKMSGHETECNKRWERNEKRLANIETKIVDMSADIHYIKGKLDAEETK